MLFHLNERGQSKPEFAVALALLIIGVTMIVVVVAVLAKLFPSIPW